MPVNNEREQSVASLTKAPVFKLKREHRGVMACLTDQQRELIHEWLGTMSYDKICQRCMERWKLKVWRTQLSRYHSRFVATAILDRRQKQLDVVDLVNKDIDKTPGEYARLILDGLGRNASEAITNPQAHPKVIAMLVDTFTKMRTNEKTLALWERKLAVKERELDLREKQLEATRETARDLNLTPEERAERWREIFKVRLDEPDEAQTNGNGFTA